MNRAAVINQKVARIPHGPADWGFCCVCQSEGCHVPRRVSDDLEQSVTWHSGGVWQWKRRLEREKKIIWKPPRGLRFSTKWVLLFLAGWTDSNWIIQLYSVSFLPAAKRSWNTRAQVGRTRIHARIHEQRWCRENKTAWDACTVQNQKLHREYKSIQGREAWWLSASSETV